MLFRSRGLAPLDAAAIDTGLGVVNVVHALLDNSDWPDRRTAAQEVLDRLIEAARVDGAIDQDVTSTDIALATLRYANVADPTVEDGRRPPKAIATPAAREPGPW